MIIINCHLKLSMGQFDPELHRPISHESNSLFPMHVRHPCYCYFRFEFANVLRINLSSHFDMTQCWPVLCFCVYRIIINFIDLLNGSRAIRSLSPTTINNSMRHNENKWNANNIKLNRGFILGFVFFFFFARLENNTSGNYATTNDENNSSENSSEQKNAPTSAQIRCSFA